MSSPISTDTSLELQSNPIINIQHSILTRPNHGVGVEWNIVLSFAIRIVAYVSLLVVLVILVFLIFKYLGECDNHATVERTTITTETNHLIPNKVIPITYGTCEEDLEFGKSDRNLSDDLYDGKICIICYDEPRNCFFVPCGHCATCHLCAQRIVEEENKACPVCRRFIHRIKKLFATQNQNTDNSNMQRKIECLE